jgi:hypothetical protein
MQQITTRQLFDGAKFYGFYGYSTYVDTTDTDPYPGMTFYQGSFNVSASGSNTLGIGSKSFDYITSSPLLTVGQLIKIKSTSTIVSGYMLGVVTSASIDGAGITHINVDTYEFYGNGVSTQWNIILQLDIGANAVQNPNAPHIAKLVVADAQLNTPSTYLASVLIPSEINNTETITSNTPTHYAGYTFTKWKKQIVIFEDFSDLHKPWLGTTVTIRVKIAKTTTTLAGSTVDYEFRDYDHTFTGDNFSTMAAGFQPGQTYPNYPTQSRCTTYSADYIDNFTSTFEYYYNSDGDIISETLVTYSFPDDGNPDNPQPWSYVKDVSPGSFFEPPTP